MAEHQIHGGNWVASSRQCSIDGVYDTRGAAKLAYKLTPCELNKLWKRKGFTENGNADGTTDYALTHADMTEAINAKQRSRPEPPMEELAAFRAEYGNNISWD